MTGRPRRVAPAESLSKTSPRSSIGISGSFFSGQLISFTGTWMKTTRKGWLVYHYRVEALLGLVAAAASAPMLFFCHWGGWVAIVSQTEP